LEGASAFEVRDWLRDAALRVANDKLIDDIRR
jgi:hypothetical protein